MILIAGDSWGCGEWTNGHVSHRGLQQYLIEAGHSVNNISHGGISNLDTATRIELYLKRNFNAQVSKAFVFQTEFDRDHKHWYMHDQNDWNDIEGCWLARFYNKLSNISQQYQFPIYLIGGAGDVVGFDDMSMDHPGCLVACQSMTNLLCRSQDTIEIPVHSWYTNNSQQFVEMYRSQKPRDVKSLLEKIDLGFCRESLLRENPQYFYPDGVHPNQLGHLMLFEFLSQKHLVDQ
jgi:hypothetical protein